METTVKIKTIWDTAKEGGFSRFIAAAQEAGFDEILSGTTKITLFAPTDTAFEKISAEGMHLLRSDKQKLSDVIAYHIVPGRHTLVDVMNLVAADTLQGEQLSISACDEVTVNDVPIVRADIDCSNGIIHGVDGLLLPPHITLEQLVMGE